MHKHDKHPHPDHTPEHALAHQSYIGDQLEPERYLLEYQIGAAPWATLGVIGVTTDTETWTVDRTAVAVLANDMTRLRLSTSATAKPPSGAGALVETTPTVVTWVMASIPRYPGPIGTFAGPYVHSGGKGTLAINFQVREIAGGAAIVQAFWCNPDPRAAPVSLKLSGGSVILGWVTGSYGGDCFTTTSINTYTP